MSEMIGMVIIPIGLIGLAWSIARLVQTIRDLGDMTDDQE